MNLILLHSTDADKSSAAISLSQLSINRHYANSLLTLICVFIAEWTTEIGINFRQHMTGAALVHFDITETV